MTKLGLFIAAVIFVSSAATAEQCDDKTFQRIRDQVVVIAAEDAQMMALVAGRAEWGDDTTVPGSPTLSHRAAQGIALSDAIHTYRLALEAYQAAYATICYAN